MSDEIKEKEEVPQKPMKARPMLYTCIFETLRVTAREMGYNLLIHGSLTRDLDIVAVPWVWEPQPEIELIKAMHKQLTGVTGAMPDGNDKNYYMHSILPGGRSSYVINLNRGGRFNNYMDEQYYIDISITPLLKQHQ